MNIIYVAYDHMLFVQDMGNTVVHEHNMKHLTLSLDGVMHCYLNGEPMECYGYFLNHHVLHERIGEESKVPSTKLIFIFEQGSLLSEAIDQQILKGEAYTLISRKQYEAIRCIWEKGDLQQAYREKVNSIFQICGINYMPHYRRDSRIQKVLQDLHQLETVENDFLEKALDEVNLSRSRFLHLVKEETGISYKNLLLMEKFLKTWKYIARGENITEACIHGGFSDSAHFANYMKNSFGLPTKQELQSVSQVIWTEGEDR